MTVQINYKNSSSKKDLSNLVLFVDEKFNIAGLKNDISKSEFLYITDLLKSRNLKKDLQKITSITSKAHQLIGCKGVTRSDFKFYKGKFYLLEINTQPGMTKLSLVPEIAKYAGISFIKLIEWILKDASINR